MSDMGGHRQFVRAWFTAQELAEMNLPALPKGRQHITQFAIDQRWSLKTDVATGAPLWRRRPGRGGASEFHYSVLPAATIAAMSKRGIIDIANQCALPSPTTPLPPREQAWAEFERRSQNVRDIAQKRLEILVAVEGYERSGWSVDAAIGQVANERHVAKSSIYSWRTLVRGVPKADRLPALAPNFIPGGVQAHIPEPVWQIYKSDWLRGEEPSYTSCYERAVQYATKQGLLPVPKEITFRRRLRQEVPEDVIVRLRKGRDAHAKMEPAQERDVSDLRALEYVNIDGHRWDVAVMFPGEDKPRRPMMIGIQCVYSRKMLAWRIGKEECVSLTRLAFADLFRNHGIPEKCLLDNSRTFASKWFTGGAKTRNRFKIKEDEPLGMLIQLGIQNMWATPYHGQAKPIERAWKDFAQGLAKHPAFAGAYVGKDTKSKPHNYGSKTVDLATFERVVAAGIAAHNAKTKRKTQMGLGIYSFDEVYNNSIEAGAIIQRATEEQVRMALLAGDRVRAHRTDGSISLFGNRYWSPGMATIAGQSVTVRFDADNLHTEIHVYGADNQFFATVPLLAATGFHDQDAAKLDAKRRSEHRKNTLRNIELQNLIAISEVAALLGDYDDETEQPQPKVVRPIRLRGGAAAAQQQVQSFEFVDQFAARAARLRVVE